MVYPRQANMSLESGQRKAVEQPYIGPVERAAQKLQNPRLLRITFHTFRHWKATMLYHQTKVILCVKNFLGHRKIENTLLYIQLAEAIFKETTDEFTVRVAKEPTEIKELLEVGFEYVCDKRWSNVLQKTQVRNNGKGK